MLIIITGDRQVGKTRFLERLIDEAEASGLRCIGLLSPGVWVDKNDGGFEKVGISATLLPQKENIDYAIRRDLADTHRKGFSQSDKANLGWRIHDEAIERINAHFDELALQGMGGDDVLIIDEIGTLELVHGKGLTSVLSMLDNPQATSERNLSGDIGINAVIIIRPELLDEAIDRFSPAWGGPVCFDANELDINKCIKILIGKDDSR